MAVLLPTTFCNRIFLFQLFDLLKKTNPDCLSKVTAIAGDVQELALGISPDDRKILTDNVHFIYHAAASIRFDDPLRKAVFLNVRGTKFMLDLAKECKQLEVSASEAHTGASQIFFVCSVLSMFLRLTATCARGCCTKSLTRHLLIPI